MFLFIIVLVLRSVVYGVFLWIGNFLKNGKILVLK